MHQKMYRISEFVNKHQRTIFSIAFVMMIIGTFITAGSINAVAGEDIGDNITEAIDETLPDVVQIGLILGVLASFGLIGWNMRRN